MTIKPDNFQNFIYAKQSHLPLFHDYEPELYNHQINFAKSDLKRYQDLLVFAFIKQNVPVGSRILEVGGGYSRILEHFHQTYECWNIDPFEGSGNGPTELKKFPYRLVRDYMGNYNPTLPDNYFDFVFSISALEHAPTDDHSLTNIVNDINRVLKQGGYSLHTLDSLVKDNQFNFLHPFAQKAASRSDSFSKLPDLAEIVSDKDIYFMTKEAYDICWKHITKKEYEDFGCPTSINVLWMKA